MPLTTAAQLLSAQHIPRCELVRGKLRRLPLKGGECGRLAATLMYELSNHVKPAGLGVVWGNVGFVLSRRPDTVRAADVAFTAATRSVPAANQYLEGAPDIVVEILSPDDRPGDVRDKTEMWMDAGAMLVWDVDPRTHTVTVHRRGRGAHTLAEADTLTGGSILPDFELALRDLFA